MYDVIIIGSGPAGLSAAVYCSRAQLSAAVIEKEFMGTGQITVTDRVDNYLGLPGISGYDIGDRFRSHAEQMGAQFIEGEVASIEKQGDVWRISLADGKPVESRTVIYAAGASHRKLDVPGGDLPGVSYCAVCDGGFYKGKVCAVVGGGDTALGDALYLSKLAAKVYIIHRRDSFRANKSLQEKVRAAENIELVLDAVPSAVLGENRVGGIEVQQHGEKRTIEVDGVFAAIGMIPNTAPLEGVCNLENGYVKAGEDGKTSAAGLFAAGDVRTTPLRQVITAAADGANCAASAEEYLR